jgi:hypothetical protein
MATAQEYPVRPARPHAAPGGRAPAPELPAPRARVPAWPLVMAASPTYSRRFKLLAAAVLAVAITMLFFAVRAMDEGGDDPVLRDDDAAIVENLLPRRNAQVPQQSNVGIDLVTGWEGTLVIQGIEIPEDELQVTPEIGLIEFTPGEGRAVEELESGQNCVSAIIWRIRDGRGVNDRTIPWCFEVV